MWCVKRMLRVEATAICSRKVGIHSPYLHDGGRFPSMSQDGNALTLY